MLAARLVKPNCTITRKEVDNEDTLVCTAYGNPTEFSFTWALKSENETLNATSAKDQDMMSYLVLKEEFIEMRTYRCVANNSVGMGTYCEIDVAGKCMCVYCRPKTLTILLLL